MRRFGRVAVVVSLLVACSAEDAADPPSTTIGDTGGEESFDDPLGNSDGSWNLEAVLGVFAARHGALPGVDPADDATSALLDDQRLADVLSKRLDELSAEVRSVVEAWLLPGPAEQEATYVISGDSVVELIDGQPVPVEVPTLEELFDEPSTSDDSLPSLETIAPDPTGGPSRVPHGASARPSLLRALAYLNAYKVLSQVTLPNFELRAERGPTPRNVGATALPLPNGRLGCRIRISSTETVDANTLPHEVYHCFQFGVRVPLGLHPYDEPRWVMEGSASYASIKIAPTSWADGFYAQWTSGRSRPLSARDYDAIGFYETLQEADGRRDMWRLMVQLLSTNAPDTVLSSELRVDDFAHWGAQDHQDRSFGPFFYFHKYPDVSRRVRDVQVRLGARPVSLSVPRLSSRAFSLQGTWGDGILVVEPSVSGVLRVGSTYVRGFSPGGTARLCFTLASCTPCPARPGLVVTRVANVDALIGAASVAGGEIRVSLISRDRLCDPCPAAGPSRASHSDPRNLTANLARTVPPICEPATTVAEDPVACLVGDWLVDNAAMALAFQALTSVPGTPGNQVVEGSFSIRIGADGTMEVSVVDWTVTSEQAGPEGTPPILFESIFNGAVTGKWRADATTFTTSNTTGVLGGRAYITIAGTRTEVTGPQLPNLPVGNGASSYLCTPDGGLVIRARAAGAVDLVFVRSG